MNAQRSIMSFLVRKHRPFLSSSGQYFSRFQAMVGERPNSHGLEKYEAYGDAPCYFQFSAPARRLVAKSIKHPCESNSKPILDESIRTANWSGSTHSKRQHGIDQSKLISLC